MKHRGELFLKTAILKNAKFQENPKNTFALESAVKLKCFYI